MTISWPTASLWMLLTVVGMLWTVRWMPSTNPTGPVGGGSGLSKVAGGVSLIGLGVYPSLLPIEVALDRDQLVATVALVVVLLVGLQFARDRRDVSVAWLGSHPASIFVVSLAIAFSVHGRAVDRYESVRLATAMSLVLLLWSVVSTGPSRDDARSSVVSLTTWCFLGWIGATALIEGVTLRGFALLGAHPFDTATILAPVALLALGDTLERRRSPRHLIPGLMLLIALGLATRRLALASCLVGLAFVARPWTASGLRRRVWVGAAVLGMLALVAVVFARGTTIRQILEVNGRSAVWEGVLSVDPKALGWANIDAPWLSAIPAWTNGDVHSSVLLMTLTAGPIAAGIVIAWVIIVWRRCAGWRTGRAVVAVVAVNALIGSGLGRIASPTFVLFVLISAVAVRWPVSSASEESTNDLLAVSP